MSFAMIITGSFVVVNKFILQYIPVFLASELRLLIASLVLIPVFLAKREKLPQIKLRDALILLLQSFVGVFLYSLCILYGLKKTTALESGIILSTSPAVMAFISWFILKEKLNRGKQLGITLIVFGTLSINIAGILLTGKVAFSSLFGNVLILLAVISNAVFFLFGKLLDSWPSLAISMVLSVLGALLFLPFAISDVFATKWQNIPFFIWIQTFYTGTVVTVLAVYLMNQGIKRVSGNTAAAFPALSTISTTLLSWIALNEKIYWYHFLGIAFILLGIIVMTLNSRQTKGVKDYRRHA